MRLRLRFPWFWVQLAVFIALVAMEVAYLESPTFPPWGLAPSSLATGFLVLVLGTVVLPGAILSFGLNQAILFARLSRVTSLEERQLMSIEVFFLIASLVTGMLTEWLPVFVFSVFGLTISALIASSVMSKGTRLLRSKSVL